MKTERIENSMALIVMNIVAAVGTVIYNGLSQAIPIGISTNAEIANRLPIYFFPANFTFSIWGIIFLALIAFAIYQALPSQRSNPFVRAVGPWLILSSLGNIGWLLVFQYEQFALSMIPIVWLLFTLGMAYVRIRRVAAVPTTTDRMFIFAPISIYFAWAAVATVANTTYFLYTASGLTPDATWLGITQPVWGAIMLIVAGIITTTVAVMNRDLVYMAVVVWAFGGIFARYPEVMVVAVPAAGMALLGILAVLAATIFWRGQPSLPRAAV
jgi:hypothetical protein